MEKENDIFGIFKISCITWLSAQGFSLGLDLARSPPLRWKKSKFYHFFKFNLLLGVGGFLQTIQICYCLLSTWYFLYSPVIWFWFTCYCFYSPVICFYSPAIVYFLPVIVYFSPVLVFIHRLLFIYSPVIVDDLLNKGKSSLVLNQLTILIRAHLKQWNHNLSNGSPDTEAFLEWKWKWQ